MVLASLLVYGHPQDASRADMNRLRRALFGWTDRTHGRTYRRPGLLTGKPHIAVRDGALVVPLDLGPAVEAVAKKHGAWTWARRVEVSVAEARKLYPAPSP